MFRRAGELHNKNYVIRRRDSVRGFWAAENEEGNAVRLPIHSIRRKPK